MLIRWFKFVGFRYIRTLLGRVTVLRSVLVISWTLTRCRRLGFEGPAVNNRLGYLSFDDFMEVDTRQFGVGEDC